MKEEHGLPYKIKVLVSKDLGQDELVVGLGDLKDINILHKEFPSKLPEWRRDDARIVNVQYNSIRGDQLNEFKEPVKDFKGAEGPKKQRQEFQELDQEFKEPVKEIKGAEGSKEQSQEFQESDQEFKEPVKDFKGAEGSKEQSQ